MNMNKYGTGREREAAMESIGHLCMHEIGIEWLRGEPLGTLSPAFLSGCLSIYYSY